MDETSVPEVATSPSAEVESTQPPASDTTESPPKQPTPEPVYPPKNKIRIILKTPKEKQNIEVDEDASIKDIKATAADKFLADPDYLCLIFAGKMMEESDTLETHGVKDGMTIHLIVKTAPRQAEPIPKRPPVDISQTPFDLGNLGGLVGLEALGMGSANFMELQNRLQTELLGNPEMLRRVLDNPLVQTLMNDSDNMKILIAHNPQMQDLMARHPEIRSMLNNTEILKHTAELARNPSMLQELMRNVEGCQDLEGDSAFSSISGMYRDMQQPNITTAAQKVAESQKRGQDSSVFNNPQMSSLLQQMCENPQSVQNMLSAPYTQAMLQAMAADPSMATCIVNENPLFRGNPQLQQYITSMMPQLVNQLQNAEIQNMMANPQAVNALMQIQEGMEQLRNVAPGLVNNIGLGSFTDYSAVRSNSNDTSSTSDASPTTSAPTDSFSQFMARMVSSMGQATDTTLDPQQRFKVQLEYLKSMGFTNEEDNLKLLTANFGDINATVQRLLAQNKRLFDM